MAEQEADEPDFKALQASERSLVLSFLSLSERSKDEAQAMEELAEAIALKAALREKPN